MSNHVHLLVRDSGGDLAAWASYFLGNLARAVNRTRERQGHVFARRYSAEPVLDADALLDRLVYVVTNPVQAKLCDRATDWPGVVLWSRSGEAERHLVAPDDAMKSPGAPPAHLLIHPLPHADPHSVAAAIRHAEVSLQAERMTAGIRLVGRRGVLAQRWNDRPRNPKSSVRPLCHAADASLRAAFKEAFGSFVDAFREASSRLREGMLDATFPPWSFPPGRPLVRESAA